MQQDNNRFNPMNERIDPESERLQLIAVKGIPDVLPGDDISELILKAQEKMDLPAEDGDIYVISQKIVSKAEGRLVRLDDIVPSSFALQLSETIGKDPKETEVILRESRSIIKARLGILITETRHGIICANSGVDRSNVKGDQLLLLPISPDESARRIKVGIESKAKKRVAVIISDTFGRPWREGHVDFAIGVSGIECFRDYRGRKDMYGRELKVTMMAQADEIASAAELLMGKAKRVPVVIVRGYSYAPGEGSQKMIRPVERDLFR